MNNGVLYLSNIHFGSTGVAVKSGNDYIFTQGGMTVVFKMTEGVLTSVVVTGAETVEGVNKDINGTYAPAPVISTIADVLATVDEFPTSSDSKPVPAPDAAWVTANG